jgi:hypothetical protein
MRKLPFLFFLILSLAAFSQQHGSPPFKRGALLLGFGFGTKTYCGNFGLTSNFFLNKNFNLHVSIGIGPVNYNGGIVSAGPQFCGMISERMFLVVGSVYTYAGGTYDVINDEQPDRRAYETDADQYIRSFAGLGFASKGGMLFKIETGYSHVLNTPEYVVYGPGTWSAGQINSLERQLGSGLLLSFSFGIKLSDLKRD